jgi:hypothetical protein
MQRMGSHTPTWHCAHLVASKMVAAPAFFDFGRSFHTRLCTRPIGDTDCLAQQHYFRSRRVRSRNRGSAITSSKDTMPSDFYLAACRFYTSGERRGLRSTRICRSGKQPRNEKMRTYNCFCLFFGFCLSQSSTTRGQE